MIALKKMNQLINEKCAEWQIDSGAGEEMYRWAKELFPVCRSLTGNGVRFTLEYFKKILPDLKIHETPTGTKAFDWEVPQEWNISDAFLIDPEGQKIVDFNENNLHVVGYSTPVSKSLTLSELQGHLYSIKEQPSAIPYVTSYYKKNWGFCMSQEQRDSLREGIYTVKIESSLDDGSLTYADMVLPGDSKEEILLHSYVCHPSMANNELSGPVVAVALMKALSQMERRKYTYRLVLVPETIGTIVYLSEHLEHLKKHTRAGYVITCVGDEGQFSFLPTKYGDEYVDKISKFVLNEHVENYTSYTFMDRGSDERQYCSALVNMPVASIMKSKYGTYPEYHTSLDNLSFISSKGLFSSLEILFECCFAIEMDGYYVATFPCEPRLGKYNLFDYPAIGGVTRFKEEIIPDFQLAKAILAYADSSNSVVDFSSITGASFRRCVELCARLETAGLIKMCEG